jgi:ABC-type antimicrobial peptide transport system permease subunit
MVWHVVPAPTADALKRDFQEVTMSVAMQKGYNPVLRVGNEVFNEANLYYSGPSFFDLFSFRLLAGDPENVLSDPYSVVISESIAERFFGNSEPLGKTLLLDNKQLLTITGILEDTPSNSHLKIDYLVPFSILAEKGRNLEKWGNIDYITYIKLADNVNPEQFNRKIGSYLEDKNMFGEATLFINPLDRIHLYNDPGFENFSTGQNSRGPIKKVVFFGLAGILILILACINFINLATATATGRAREIGVRKVAGAGRADLMLRMFGESVLQTLIATAIAFLFAVLLAPLFERISGIEITEGNIFNLKNITASLVLMFITGILAGTYPALVLSSFSPVKVLRPSVNNSLEGSRLRIALVIFQFVLTVIFVFSITVMSRQIHFMQNKKPGFDTEGIMVITLSRGTGDEANYDALMSELRSIAAVEAVAMGGSIPVNMGNFNIFSKWTGNETGKSLKFHMLQVDDDYLDLLGLEIVSGRPITRGSYNDEVVINQTAARQMDMADPVGKLITGNGKTFTVVGVVKDFYFRKLNEEIKPVIIYKNPEWWMRRILVRLSPGVQSDAIERISSVVKAFTPDFPVTFSFLDEELKDYYRDERNVGMLMDAATFLSLVISCIGLFGLAAFTTRRRYREIGLRKAHGATPAGLVALLSREYVILVLISSVIALPAGYWLTGRWLAGYAERISITPQFFILTILSVTCLSLLTVAFHTIRAAFLDPARTLREE